ncbi:copper resistance protein CopC [Kineococcus sp. NBC_00420]|uniref:copper resistance CopC family protein n=1 Tax=Kineococcus sp. NBC_00420 TaxID=2903564 RepID=UPI002E1A6DF5
MQTFSDRRTTRTTTGHATQRPGRRRAGVLLLAGLLTPVLPVLTAGPAAAHDRLESTDPADGSTLDVAPDAVVLTMSSAPLALGTQVQVTGPAGVVSSGEPRIVDETITEPLTGDLPAGSYEVQWRVTSSDGHPISGSFTFTATGAATPTGTTTLDPVPTAAPSSSSPGTSTAGTVDPSRPDSGSGDGAGNGALIAIAAAIVVVGAGTGGIIGYRRRQR